MLCAITDSHRGAVSHALYRAYWVEGADVSDPDVLLAVRTLGLRKHTRLSSGSHAARGAYCDVEPPQVARKHGADADASCFTSESYKEQLRRNTDEAVERGSPGVPAFWVDDQLFWGGDRLHFVDRALGNPRAALPRICPPPPGGVVARRRLTVYHDFSSPWRYVSRGMPLWGGYQHTQLLQKGVLRNLMSSYIGSTQIERVAREAGPGVQLEIVPILLGALFKQCDGVYCWLLWAEASL